MTVGLLILNVCDIKNITQICQPVVILVAVGQP